jgi:HPt (histidine-containing phosphotransfer) domain-containing protein
MNKKETDRTQSRGMGRVQSRTNSKLHHKHDLIFPLTTVINMQSIKNETGKGFVISGLNVKKGIYMTGGTIDNYRSALAMYCRDGYEKVKEIEECLDNIDLKLFTTYTHVLKVSSASIGADRLSAAAADLEMAGVRGDTDFIHTHTDNFLKNLKKMLQSINVAISNESNNSDLVPSIDADELKRELILLRTALIDYDARILNEASKHLSRFTHDRDIGDAINNILHYTLVGGYDAAVSLIDKFLEEGV